MQLFLIGLNIFLVLLYGGLAGSNFAQEKKKSAWLNLATALIWFLVAMFNVISLSMKHT